MEKHKRDRLERRETDKKLAAGKQTHAWFGTAATKCKKAEEMKAAVEAEGEASAAVVSRWGATQSSACLARASHM